MKSPYNERLLRFTAADEAVLSAKLDAVRSAIDHPAEKGRAVEENIRHFIRELLPSEYGVSTGFIAFHDNACQKEIPIDSLPPIVAHEYVYSVGDDTILISPQLDIIVYDALRFGPIARLGTCDVFPAEAVYAYIEVKSMIDGISRRKKKSDLQGMLLQSRTVREIKIRQYHVPIPSTYINTMLVVTPMREVIDIRSFAFVLEAKGKLRNADALCEELHQQNQNEGGFFSGLYVYGVGMISSHHSNTPDDPLNGQFEVIDKKNPLAAFKNALYTSLYRFPRPEKNWTPAIDRYYQLSPTLVPRILLEHDPEKKTKSLVIHVNELSVSQVES